MSGIASLVIQQVRVDRIRVDEDLLSLVPRRTPAEQRALEISIQVNGIKVPVRLEANTLRLLDGHCRLAAANALGLTTVPAVAEVVHDELTLREEVISSAAAVRELTDGQRLDLAMELLGIERDRAKKRMAQGGRRRKGPDTCPDLRPEAGESRDIVAMRVGLGSGRTLDRGLRVLRHGDDELVAALRVGNISIARAWRQVEAKLHSTSTATASSKSGPKDTHAGHREDGRGAEGTRNHDSDAQDDSHASAASGNAGAPRKRAVGSDDRKGAGAAEDDDVPAAQTSGVAREIDRIRAALAHLDKQLADLRGRKALRGRGLELVQAVVAFLRERDLLDEGALASSGD